MSNHANSPMVENGAGSGFEPPAPPQQQHRTVEKSHRTCSSVAPSEEERQLDFSLRPRSLAEFVGQERLKRVLGMSIDAARKRDEALDHVLFSAPPGLGKTSLAHIIARELGANLRVTWAGDRTGGRPCCYRQRPQSG